MISHEHKCIFIHVPKCAGTSIEEALGHHSLYSAEGVQDHRTLTSITPTNFPFDLASKVAMANYARKELLFKLGYKRKRNIKNSLTVSREQFQNYFKFTIIRNPWSRCYSWYRHVMRDPVIRNAHHIDQDMTFTDFIYKFGGKGNLRPQLFWIAGENGISDLNFIGRFENLQADFSYVCEKLGVDNITLPHKLDGGKSNYRDAYNSEIRDYVGKLYAEEVALFSYDF